MKLLIAYGSLGKLFHLEEFSHALEKQNVQVKLVKDTDFSRGFPSKKISDWFNGDKKFKELIREFKPDLQIGNHTSPYMQLSQKCQHSFYYVGIIGKNIFGE